MNTRPDERSLDELGESLQQDCEISCSIGKRNEFPPQCDLVLLVVNDTNYIGHPVLNVWVNVLTAIDFTKSVFC